MSLFNFFRKKETKYDLDTLCQRGVNEPEYRIQFLQALLDSDLIVLVQYGTTNQAAPVPVGNTTINVFVLKDGRIPVFTSPERLFEKEIINLKADYRSLNARVLFESLKGKKYVLNPSSGIQKEFSADEIERLLNGRYFDSSIYIKQLEHPVEVRIKQPAVYPDAIVASLTKLFLERPEVKSGYVAWIDNPTMSAAPHYIFAVDVTSGWESLCSEMGFLVRQIIGEKDFAEFIRLKDTRGIEDYFVNNTQPFYKSNR